MLRRNYKERKDKLETLTSSSVDNLLKKVRCLASRPKSEFSRFEVLEFAQSLKNSAQDTKHEKANYYKLTYETLSAKMNSSDEQFREFLLPLLGDKDHEKIMDIVGKVKKNNRKRYQEGNSIRRAESSSLEVKTEEK